MKDIFPILAIETSGDLCSVAVLLNKTSNTEFNLLQKFVHSEKLLELIDQSLATIGITVNDLKSVAVSMGPGSFTGLRIGLSVAKGIAMGREIPIIPVPTFDSISKKLADILPANQKFVIANKVNVDEVYTAGYQVLDNGYKCTSPISVIDRDEISITDSNKSIIYSDSEQIGRLIVNTALSIGKWAYIYGEDLLTFDFDYLEPSYLKQFKIRG